jgi:PAS domain S-box-containing protein
MRYITILAGTSSLLLGVSVLIGWYSGNTALIQINPAFVPMQYNTALGFLFCGAGLLALNFEIRRLAVVAACLLVMIGGLTLLQYIFAIDLGIDQLLMEHYITTETSHPGRMAPNTALCFFLSGMALITGIFRNVPKFLPGSGVLGVLVFCLGFIALSGYFIDLEVAYGWGQLTRMAVHTAVGFLFVGLGLYSESIRLSKTGIVAKKSLVTNTMIRMLIATTVVVLISAGFIYMYIMSTLESQTKESLEIYISERAKLESYRFETGETSHNLFREIFMIEYARMDEDKLTVQFHDLFKLVDDGTYRTIREAYDGIKRPTGTLKIDITGFVMDVDTLTKELKARIMLLENMTDHYGPAWIDRFPNLGMITPENAHVSYWPGSTFALDVPADFDLREREWYRLALADPNNTIYSGLVFDENLGEWAVSAARAIFDGPRHLFTIVNDIKVNDLIQRVLEDPLAGTHNFLIRKNGNLILHPLRTAAIQQAEGTYNVFQQEDTELIGIMDLINNNSADLGILTDAAHDQFIAYSRLNGPGWYLVNIYPRQLLRTSAMNAVRFILLLGLFLIVLEISLLFLLVRGQVIQPLARFITAINNITAANFNLSEEARRELPLHRQDEVGELARSFNSMAGQLREHSTTLEDRVSARTKELSESQEELLVQKEMLDKTLQNMDQGIIMTDEDLNILTYNTRYPEILNLPTDVIEKYNNYADVIRYFSEKVMLHAPKTIEELTKAATSKEKLIYTIDLPDGKIIEVRHIPKEGGGYVRIFTDITEREKARIEAERQVKDLADARKATLNMMQDAEEAHRKIHESEERFTLAMEAANVGMWDTSLPSRNTTFSEQYFEMLGYKREDFEQDFQTFINLIHPDDAKRLGDVAEKFYAGETEVIEEEFRMVASNGEVRTIMTSGKIVSKDEDGLPTRVTGVHLDITERKLMEEEIQKAREAAEAATEAKASFLASMSHEIRTPMNGIIGMVDLLRQSNMSADHRQMLQTISNSGQTLLTIINDILDFSKIEAGKLDLESISFSMLDTLESSVETIRPAALKKNLKLITYVDPTIPQFVLGDPVRVRQILINLGGNAIKFTEQGEVVIRADQIDSEEDKLTIRFSVSDNGIGISEEAQKKLFQEFSQVDTSTTRKYGGTGLGLSICQSLAEMMGGVIGVKSVLGEGSEFFVNLPFTPSDREIEENKVKDLSGLKILLVIDSEMENFVCQKYLEYWNAELEFIDDIDRCLEISRSKVDEGNMPDVIVLGSDWDREHKFSLRKTFLESAELADIKFVILMPGRRTKARLDNAETVTLDVSPLKRVTFLSAVSIAAGRASPEVYYEDEVEDLKATEILTPEEALAKGELILVAEDNLTNQDVITRQLNMLGYACEMTDDGKQALEAWHTKDYAILLTDCHMPEMDGFELTDAIRQHEKGTEQRKPIIAITANALQGEAERCLAAGMDDYMSKPVAMKELRDKLRKWMPHAQAAKAHVKKDDRPDETSNTVSSTKDKGDAAIDESALKAMFGDDEEMFKEILNDFIEPSQKIIEEVKTGWEERSAEAVKQAAHKLKSSARSVGANALADLCQALETAGKEDDWNTIDDGMTNLNDLMHEVENYISAL